MNAVIVVPVGIYLIYQRQYYVSPGREIKRLESVSKSPIYNYVSETMSGRSVLRAAKLDQVLIKQFMGLENDHTSVNLLGVGSVSYYSSVVFCPVSYFFTVSYYF